MSKDVTEQEVFTEEAGNEAQNTPQASEKYALELSMKFNLALGQDVEADLDEGMSEEDKEKFCNRVVENVGYAINAIIGAQNIRDIEISILEFKPDDTSESNEE